MGPSGTENGWERWRGEADAKLDRMEDDLRVHADWRDRHEALYLKLSNRLTSVETKLVFFAALAAGLGAMLPQLFAAAVKHL